MSSDVYLCYNAVDEPTASVIRDDLLKAGITVWADGGLEPGTDAWKVAVRAGLRDAACLVVVLAADVKPSGRLRAEIDYGCKHHKAMIYVRLSGNPLADVVQAVREVIETPFGPDAQANMPGPFAWCYIPAGQVSISVDHGLLNSEVATFDVDTFLMAKYPITVAQYAEFINAPDGYDRVLNWDYAKAGREWRRIHHEPMASIKSADDAPRVRVTWFEAMAFCTWLNNRLDNPDWTLTLPSEAQWVRAAQGDTDRLYPWGELFEVERCVVLEGQFPGPQPVMAHPSGCSPFGVYDMSGNVWEWTCSEPGRMQVRLDGAGERVLRGGAWNDPASDASVASRFWQSPDTVDAGFGFRIVAVRRVK